jgi:hypothetical protein
MTQGIHGLNSDLSLRRTGSQTSNASNLLLENEEIGPLEGPKGRSSPKRSDSKPS